MSNEGLGVPRPACALIPPPWVTDMIGQRTRTGKSPGEGRVASGKETLRLRTQGPAVLEEGVKPTLSPLPRAYGCSHCVRVGISIPVPLGVPGAAWHSPPGASPPAQPLRGGSCPAGGRSAGELHGHP